MANAERLLELQDKIIEVDRLQHTAEYKGPRWHQNHWRVVDESCGTLMCSAGWTCELDAKRRGDSNPWASDHLLFATAEEIGSPGTASFGRDWGRVVIDDRPIVSARERAQRILELTDAEVDVLFYGVDPDDIDGFKTAIADIIAGNVVGYDVFDE